MVLRSRRDYLEAIRLLGKPCKKTAGDNSRRPGPKAVYRDEKLIKALNRSSRLAWPVQVGVC